MRSLLRKTTGCFGTLFKPGGLGGQVAGAPSPDDESAVLRAIVVDDSAVARRALSDMLEEAGFDVATAESASDAESQLARRGPGGFDIILMDLQMPGGTGIDACARIRQRPEWRDIPVIVVTGSGDDDDLAQAFAAGATDYLLKPPRQVELMARVRAALRLKREMDRRRAREVQLERLNGCLRDQATELSDAKEALQDLNQGLERRVRVQVEEIVERAQEIERLNAQLRLRVRERSRELAQALRGLSRGRRHSRRIAPGRVLGGRVQLVRRLAEGGMGVVYLGYDHVIAAAVAVKLLHKRPGANERDLQRFIAEAEAAAAIAHPAIVKTTHVDVTSDGDLFLIMELVDGVTLDKLLARGPLSPGWCVSIGQVVADALAAAHRVDIVHRDVKPANLMICRSAPGVRVLDFGVSKIQSGVDRVTLTETDGLIGTPAYMAPEQLESAAAVTPAADIYALGAVMFEMLTGERPFAHLQARLMQSGNEPPRVAERAREVPLEIAAIVEDCLASRPTARPSAAELASRLTALAAAIDVPAPQQFLAHLLAQPPPIVASGRL